MTALHDNLQFIFLLRLNVCNELAKAMKALDGKKHSEGIWTLLPQPFALCSSLPRITAWLAKFVLSLASSYIELSGQAGLCVNSALPSSVTRVACSPCDRSRIANTWPGTRIDYRYVPLPWMGACDCTRKIAGQNKKKRVQHGRPMTGLSYRAMRACSPPRLPCCCLVVGLWGGSFSPLGGSRLYNDVKVDLAMTPIAVMLNLRADALAVPSWK